MANKINLIIAFILFFTLVSGCGEKFNKAKWDDYDHLNGSDRSSMAEDLVENHKLVGLSYKQMVNLLDLPENDTTETWYSLK